jgi:D-alanyl-D-alanine carboxypeptidase
MTTKSTINHTHAFPRGRRVIAAMALAASAAMTVPAIAAADAPAREAPRSVEARLQAILDRAVRSPQTSFPGVALHVRRRGHGTWSGSAGRANVAPSRRMLPTHRFRAGSIMKPFVAAATLQLVEEGRFGLDDPLTTVLPPRVTARFVGAERITVRMLLNHTSGIGEYTDDAFDGEVVADPLRRWKVSELLDRAAAQPRASAPGERFGYSNANYNLLGLILERATGTSWRSVVRERVIAPLRLKHTSLPKPGHLPAGRDIARGYQSFGGALRDLTDVDSSMAGAAGGHALLTSTQDLSRFLRALLAGKLFERPQTLDAMMASVAAQTPEGRVGYGLGLERYMLPGGVELVGHMGTTAGYRAFMFRAPAKGFDLSMVLTSPDDPTPVLMPALELLVAEAS